MKGQWLWGSWGHRWRVGLFGWCSCFEVVVRWLFQWCKWSLASYGGGRSLSGLEIVDCANGLEMVGYANVALVSGGLFVLCHLAETQSSHVLKGGEGRRGR